jgi:hypothetical protein
MADTPRTIRVDIEAALDVDVTYTGGDRLERIMSYQARFQDMTPGGVVDAKLADPETTARMVREQMLALIAECGEALNEVGWKPWATSRHLNVASFRSELIDILRFWLNLVQISGLSAEGVYQAYLDSMLKTTQRLIDGYDGVSIKCPGCKRSYDDKGVKCVNHAGDSLGSAQDQLFMKGISYCQVRGYINHQGEPMVTTAQGDWVLADAA